MLFKKIHTKIKLLLVLFIFCFILVICKVFYIEVFEYKKLNKYASDLWSRNLPIKADRGLVLDRNNKFLAKNITTTSLIFIPNQIKNKDEVSKEISKILNVPEEKIKRHVYKKTSIERVHPEGRRLSYDVADKIKSLNFKGVYLVKESKRYYPYKNYLASTLGYVGIDNQGLSGLELEYNKYLTGKDGAIKYFSDAKGNRLKLNEIYEKPQNGMNISLTINKDIQSSIERVLDNAYKRYNPDMALAIVMDPNSGEILGLSNKPDFDPNNYQNYGINELNRNLPIFMTYEPGSTFKVITLASALNENKVDLLNDYYYDTGKINVENATLHCWKRGGHGRENYLNVTENSCNPGFASLGLKLGKNTLFNYINNFGFGKKTGIDLNGESSGILFPINRVGPVELATTAFGQGVSVTPIQQITAISAAINGGTLYKPFIVKSINEPETNSIIKSFKKQKVRNVISKNASEKVRFALESVVTNGTGRTAYIDGYRVGGKTGTAQKVKDGKYLDNNYILSFIGFLPANDPKVIVYVAIDNPKGVNQFGGVIAGPLLKDILSDSIKILNIKKPSGSTEKKYNYNDLKYITVPNLIGKSLDEIKDINILPIGKGKVLYQSPSPGDRIYENESIRVFLSEDGK